MTELVWIHAGLGVTALLAGGVAAFAPKRAGVHGWAGRIFALCMLASIAAIAWSIFVHTNVFMMGLGTIAGFAVVEGWRALLRSRRRLSPSPNVVDQLVALMALVPEEARGGCVLRRGDPEGVLVGLSREYDLLAIGNRGRAGLTGLLLGAVAGDVVRRAHCDVVTVDTAE